MNENTTKGIEMDKERFDEWFEAHFANWLRAMRGGFRHEEATHFRASLLTAWNAALTAARERTREMAPEIEAAYREGYRQRGADEFGVSTKGSTPDVDFAWEHSEAKQGASIPASRELRDGEVAAPVDLLDRLSAFLMDLGYESNVLRGFVKEINALRAQTTEGGA